MTATTTPCTTPRLKRVLTLWDLVVYGVMMISPMAPMTFFGVLMRRGNGHAVTCILIAMVAMSLTAISYGRMASVHPSAGSAFTYVGRELNQVLGYVVGWSIALDYLLNPVICVIYASQQSHVFLPAVPYWIWTVLFTAILTGLGVQGIKVSARANALLAGAMSLVVVGFFAASVRYIAGHPHDPGYLTHPLYDPKAWSIPGILGGTSLAVLAYLGFDGISTLSEEAKRTRDLLTATLLTCVAIGLLSALEVYAAQLVWPRSEPFPDLDTAFSFVAGRAWAPLFPMVGIALIVGSVGSGMAGQLAAGRLLFGMGRCGALPTRFFGAIDAKRHVPRNNVLFVGCIALAAALILPLVAGEATGFELASSLLNFGALTAFMGVNAAAFMRFFWRAEIRTPLNFVMPTLGFLVCLLLWWNLAAHARILGFVWMAIGLAFGTWKTRGFKTHFIDFDRLPDPTTPEAPEGGALA
ncbi:MAG TPA: APC family permease [Steroidobacteraceae bacterium]|jgi:amino acid transporter|nr:APC family permease [Steroidobacteraceae bacterium]